MYAVLHLWLKRRKKIARKTSFSGSSPLPWWRWRSSGTRSRTSYCGLVSCDQNLSTVILSAERDRAASSFGVEGSLPSSQLQELTTYSSDMRLGSFKTKPVQCRVAPFITLEPAACLSPRALLLNSTDLIPTRFTKTGQNSDLKLLHIDWRSTQD